MRRPLAWAVLLAVQVFPAWAEITSCENANVSVDGQQPAHVEMVCKAAEHAEILFDQCSLRPISDPVRIEIVTELRHGCVGLYHCGKDLIEVLEPSLMVPFREAGGAFSFLPIEEYFKSVVVHELAHAIFDETPCPFESCITAAEYVAYSMQVMSLPKEAQSAFEAKAGLDRRVSRDELNAMMYFMAPNRFGQKAWTHLNQRDDPCAYIGQIMEGKELLDVGQY